MNRRFALVAFATLARCATPALAQDAPWHNPSTAPYAYALPTVPGVPNPAVTQDNIKSTVCVSGWTKTVRPNDSYTGAIKVRLFQELHLTGTVSDYELDHEMSIEDGGSPDSLNNLWMQPYAGIYGARVKDRVETKMKTLVCAGTITLDTARTALMTDWIAAYRTYVGPIPGEAK